MAKPSNISVQNPITEPRPERSGNQQETNQVEPEWTTLIPNVNVPNNNIYEPEFAPKDFKQGAWLNPDNSTYGQGKQMEISQVKTAAMAHRDTNLKYTESVFIVLAKDEPNTYNDAMNSPNA